jgi:hypothetical protein
MRSLRYAQSVGSWSRGNLKDQSRERALIEVCVGYLLILIVLWVPRPWQRLLACLPVLWIAGATWLSCPSATALGLRTANLLRSFWIVGVAASLCVITIFVASHSRTIHKPLSVGSFIGSYIGYILGAFMQQFLMMDFFLLRLLRVLPPPKYAVVVTAGIFTLAHLPNPVLTPLTLLWGLVGCWHFLRYRNLYTLAVAHAILGITVAMSVPGSITHGMRVGRGYFIYRQHHFHHRGKTDLKAEQILESVKST